MTALLALIPTKDWLYCGAIVAILAGGVWYHHKVFDEGIANQIAVDARASKELKADTAKKTAELQVRATTAEQAYDKEHADNQNYRDSHPIEPIRLCLSATASYTLVPTSGAAHAGNESASAAAQNVHDLPSGNSSSGTGTAGPDISTLLGLLAAKGDDVSAELREFQNR